MSKPVFSVIIATRNRPKFIGNCIASLLSNSYRNFEIIVVDQSTNHATKRMIKTFKSKKINYIRMSERGKAKALNLALSIVKGEFVAFTDDDCVVNYNWMRGFHQIFIKHTEVAGIFGNTLPFEPEHHKNEICTACYISKKTQIISNPFVSHYHTLGQGNNMCLRKKIFSEVGNFIPWLGIGTFSQAGEDSEMIYRILRKKMLLLQTPRIKIYHNHWLTPFHERLLQGRYSCGLMAFMFFHLISNSELWKMIYQRLKERIISKILLLLHLLFRLRLKSLYYHKREIIYIIWELYCIMKGSLLGLYMGLLHKNTLL